MVKFAFDLDLSGPLPDFIGPRIPPCNLEDHCWSLTVEDGQIGLTCHNPCSEERKLTMDTSRHGPMCDVVYEFIDGAHLNGEIAVWPRIQTDYVPSTPNGSAEYDAWLVLELKD